MATEVIARFEDARTVASYVGEAVGTHYSAALRAAEAYGKYLAAVRDSLHEEPYQGENLGKFWLAVMRSEQVQSTSPTVLRDLRSSPSHYFSDFLDTADTVFQRRYQEVSKGQRKKVGQTQHAQCLRLLRDHRAEGIENHFVVQNKVATWMQMVRALGGYQE